MFRITMNDNEKNLNTLVKFEGSEPLIYVLKAEMRKAECWRKLSSESKCKEHKRILYSRAMNKASDVQLMISTAMLFYTKQNDNGFDKV